VKKKKNMIKEIFIFIVLLILVLLVLAVTLYDYIPSNVNVAEVRKYKPDSKTTSIKQEIAYTNGGDISADTDSDALITSLKSYSIEAADLNVYSNFNKGNSNPFDDYYADTETNDKANSSTPSTTSSDDKLNSSTPSTTSTDKNNGSSNTTTNDANKSNTDISNSSNGGTVGTFFESPTSK